jgi:hypothetical protein
MTARAQFKEICGRESQEACRQDELIGDKPPVVKSLWLWGETISVQREI